MTSTTRVLSYCGALFGMLAVGSVLLLFVWTSENSRWWIGAAALSSGWSFAGIAFGPARWARTAVPAAIAGLFALFYVKDHELDARAWALIVMAAITAVAHLVSMRRESRASRA